jgi:fatty-acyl-CoA synthase
MLNAPAHPKERAHKLRLITGNGLRPEIWKPFQTRFKIPKIVEFYGATEGNVSLVNFDGKVGAIGRIPSWAKSRTHMRLFKFDVETEQPVRGKDGFCVECAPGEIGEAVGEIRKEDMRTRFEGYSKGADTEKKLLRDAQKKGDVWFRTGDLMKQDAQGYFYFVDRIGDTFRWKGENVSTNEVAEAISVFPGIKEANVYGVQIPGTDGRAGMAAIVADGKLDLKAFQAHLEKNLAAYARPVFLRMQKEMDATGTFKHTKVALVKEGFDPSKIADPLFFFDPVTKAYEPLTADVYAMIVEGRLRF